MGAPELRAVVLVFDVPIHFTMASFEGIVHAAALDCEEWPHQRQHFSFLRLLPP